MNKTFHCSVSRLLFHSSLSVSFILRWHYEGVMKMLRHAVTIRIVR
jgi:hypothetical protein